MPRPRVYAHLPSLLLLCASLAGCHSWHAEAAAPAVVHDSLRPAYIRVTTHAGPRTELWHARISGDTLLGARRAGGGSPVGDSGTISFPLATISGLETRHGNTLKTIGLVYLVVLAFAVPFALSNKGY